MAYNPAFFGGVRVALGDVNGDGVRDIITAPGPGGGPHVRIWNGVDLTEMGGFFAYNPAFAGGVYVAAGDVDGDGRADIVTGDLPQIRVHIARADRSRRAVIVQILEELLAGQILAGLDDAGEPTVVEGDPLALAALGAELERQGGRRHPDVAVAKCLGGILVRPDFKPDSARLEVVRSLGRIEAHEAIEQLTIYLASVPARPPRPSRAEAERLIEERMGGGR